MKALMYKEWKLAMSPLPIVFLLGSLLLLVPSYPYYVTFFYTGLGIFFFFQSCRENQDVAYMLRLPIRKADIVRCRVRTVVTIELLQVLACIPVMAVRSLYGSMKNPVGIEANVAFLGLALVQLGMFNLTFLPLHYKNAHGLGKPFVIASLVQFLLIVVFEVVEHIPPILAYCDTYALADQLRQLPVFAAGAIVFAGLTALSQKISIHRFEQVDL